MSSEKNSEQITNENNPAKEVNEEVKELAEEGAINQTDLRDGRIAKLELEVAELQQREKDNLLRARAEMENVRRRTEQDIEKAHKFALERFSAELLPVIDNLERALTLSDKSNAELLPMIEGIELTLKSFLDVAKKFGIEVVGEVNTPFNPEWHEAMTMVESVEHAPNHITFVMQKGYTLNGRLIRPAMVAVAKSKA